MFKQTTSLDNFIGQISIRDINIDIDNQLFIKLSNKFY